jgi:hypothetical protein
VLHQVAFLPVEGLLLALRLLLALLPQLQSVRRQWRILPLLQLQPLRRLPPALLRLGLLR